MGFSPARMPDCINAQVEPLQHESPLEEQPRPHAQPPIVLEQQRIRLFLPETGKPGIRFRVFGRIFQIRNAFHKDAHVFQSAPYSMNQTRAQRKTARETRCGSNFHTLCSLSNKISGQPNPPSIAPESSR